MQLLSLLADFEFEIPRLKNNPIINISSNN